MSKPFIEMSFDSYKEFYIHTLPNEELYNKLDGFVFRGESSENYHLIPNALRSNSNFEKIISNIKLEKGINLNLELEYDQIVGECIILQEFYSLVNAQGLPIPDVSYFLDIHRSDGEYISEQIKHTIKDSIFWPPQSMWNIMALAQHYGVPTRFLDWTFDKNIAAYFAISGFFKHRKEKFDDFIIIWAINAPYFSGSNNGLKFIIPTYYNNPNLCNQKGILSCTETIISDLPYKKDYQKKSIIGLDKFFMEYPDQGLPTFLYRFKIKTTNIIDDFYFLKKIGVNASDIFYGYNGATKYFDDIIHIFKYKNNF